MPGPVSGRRVLAAVGIGLAGELSALGLLATGGWLLLSIAIGTVQLFSLLRGTARYAERLASHDLGLRVQAGLRGWLYRRLEHLVPAGLPGGDRGDLLARLVRDTEEAQDLVVRTAVPVLAARPARTAAPPGPGERTGRPSSRCAGRRPAIRTGEAGWYSAGSTWSSSRAGRSRWPGRAARARRWPSTLCCASPTSPPGR